MKFQTCLTPPNRRLSSTLSTLTQSLLPALSLLTFLAVPVLFPRHASSQRTFQMGVLVPLSGQKSMGVEVVAAAYLALDKVNDDDQLIHLRRLGYNFSVTVRDTGCDTGKGLQQVVDMVTDLSHTGKKVDAFIGPSCDNVCEAAGLLAGRWGIPMISFGCEESKLSDRKIYPTFLRTTSQFASMARFMENILLHYKWSRVMMVTTSSQVWLETEAELLHEFNSGSFKAFQWDINEEEWPGITDILREKTKISHVFILLMFGKDVLRLMKAADDAGILTGSYVFITIDFANMGKRIDDPYDGPHLTGLLDITMDVTPESSDFFQFVDDIEMNSTLAALAANDSCMHYEYGIHAGLTHDAVLLYAHAVDSSLGDGSDPRNGTQLARHMYNVTIQGVTGRVHIQEDGSRNSQFMLHNLNQGCYVPIARSTNGGQSLELTNKTVKWPGGVIRIPFGRPECGWDGTLCENKTNIIVSAVSCVIALLVIALVISLLYWRAAKKRRESSKAWIVHYDDLVHKDHRIGRSRINMGSVRNMSPTLSRSESHFSMDSSHGQVFADHCFYHNEEVAGKPVTRREKLAYITNQMTREVNLVMQLANANVCRFYGVCVDPEHEMTLWEYCKKGSLQDVIHNDKKYLEDMPFKISFMNDVTKGLRYLHHSHLGRHGRLKASNVLVDCRWTCKLAHMTIPCLTAPLVVDDVDMNYTNFLATPPEVLRDPTIGVPGTKAGDVYSFGIVLLEIFTVSEVYEAFSATHAQEKAVSQIKRKNKRKRKPSLERHFTDLAGSAIHLTEDLMEPKEIIKRVKQGGSFPFRPFIPEYIDHKTKNVIMECWREQAEERPSMDHVASLIRHISTQYSTKNKSLMEQMLDKVTREADLQAQELQEEKHKSDQLLYQMLPPTVADSLKRNLEVKPETYQSATVYFSDIQGFTELASVSDPLEIVNFLNDVYYKFDTVIEKYQVYKVETIGDAYVVCSGVPLKVENHACEIAKMALHIMSCSEDLKVHHRPQHKFLMRIGLHSGTVAAGVVGRTMPRYCLFGDTVNTASRMESTGVAGHIQVSEQCKGLLDADTGFIFETRDPIQVKGKGTLQTYFLKGKEGFNPADSFVTGDGDTHSTDHHPHHHHPHHHGHHSPHSPHSHHSYHSNHSNHSHNHHHHHNHNNHHLHHHHLNNNHNLSDSHRPKSRQSVQQLNSHNQVTRIIKDGSPKIVVYGTDTIHVGDQGSVGGGSSGGGRDTPLIIKPKSNKVAPFETPESLVGSALSLNDGLPEISIG